LRVLKRDLRHGRVKLLLDTLDDLWYLHGIVETGDLLFTADYRRGEAQSDTKRQKRAEKIRMFLGIKVEKMEFHEFSDRLRITGVIVEGPQDHGEHHTFNLTAGDDIEVVKEEWGQRHWQRVDEAVAASRIPQIAFVAIDDEEATIAIMRPQGLQVVATIEANLPGKMYDSKGDPKKEFFVEVLDTLAHVSGRDRIPEVVILGPGFTKEEIASYGRETGKLKGAHIESAGSAGKAGIREVMNSGVSKVLENAKMAEDAKTVERVMAEIGKDGKVTYGKDHVMRALEMGAVEVLVVSDEFLKDRVSERFNVLARDTNAKVTVVSTGYDAGKKIRSLGGVAALLRFKLPE
jgi:protein pelota